MLIQIYEWASSVWSMLLSLQGFFTTGIGDLINSVSGIWEAVLTLATGGLFQTFKLLVNTFGVNVSIFAILFSSAGAIGLLTLGMISWVVRGS